jgi:hypothetical protein
MVPLEIWFWVVSFFAVFLGNIAAFGISSILLPVAVSVFPFELALVLTSIFHIFGNFGRIGFFREELNKRVFLLFGVPNVIFTFIGASLVGIISDLYLKIGLGIILVIYSALGLFDKDLRVEARVSYLVVGGAVYGFFSGLVGSGGPLRGALLESFGLTKGIYVSTSGGISLLTDITRISVYLWRGYLPPGYYWYILILFIVAITGGYFSKLAVERFRSEQFQKIIHIAVLLAGLKLIIDALQIF